MIGGVLTSLALAHEPAALASALEFETFEESSLNSSRLMPYMEADLSGMKILADGWLIRDAGFAASAEHYARHLPLVSMMSGSSSLDLFLLHKLGGLVKSESLDNVVTRDQLAPETAFALKELVHASFTDAQKFLALLPEAFASSAIVDWTDDEVCVEWRNSEAAVITTFEGDGAFGYALLRDGKFNPGAVEVTNITDLPDDLLAYLNQYFSPDER